jgi:hypothetical protein
MSADGEAAKKGTHHRGTEDSKVGMDLVSRQVMVSAAQA